jgi:hypothetical protein
MQRPLMLTEAVAMNETGKMFVVREWVKPKQKGEEKGRFTHPGKFATYHEANERAKEIGPACFPQLEAE